MDKCHIKQMKKNLVAGDQYRTVPCEGYLKGACVRLLCPPGEKISFLNKKDWCKCTDTCDYEKTASCEYFLDNTFCRFELVECEVDVIRYIYDRNNRTIIINELYEIDDLRSLKIVHKE